MKVVAADIQQMLAETATHMHVHIYMYIHTPDLDSVRSLDHVIVAGRLLMSDEQIPLSLCFSETGKD